MSRCFVIEQEHPVEYYEAAAMHGKVCFLVGKQDRRPPIWHVGFITHVIGLLEAEEFDVDVDSLVISGPQVVIARVVASVVARYGPCSFLLFEPRLQGYKKMTLPEGC